MPLGLYNLVASKPTGEITSLNNCFEIEEGKLQDLHMNPMYPPSSTTGATIIIRVDYANEGNTDLDSVFLNIRSMTTSPLSFTQDGLKENRLLLQIPCLEFNGPGNILRPGAGGTSIIYAKEREGLGFTITSPGNIINRQ